MSSRVDRQPIVLESKRLRIGWDPVDGTLLSITDTQTGLEIADPRVDRRAPSAGLWRLDLEDSALWPARAMHLEVERDGQTIALSWSGFPDASALAVTAEITLAPDGFLYARLRLDGVPEEWWLDAVRFPRWVGLARTGGEEWLAVPRGLGILLHEPRERLAGLPDRRWQRAYPGGLSMQCMALYASEGQGVYLAVDDEDAHRKTMAWQCTGDPQRAHARVLNYELLNHPPLPLQDGIYEMPYRAVLGTFQGDWVTAAEIYRSWALQQRWSVHSRFKGNLAAPWLRETGLWMWNRGVSANVVQPAIVLRDYLRPQPIRKSASASAAADDVPVSVLWHWWHGCPYDVGFPEYLPPREGAEPFKMAVAQLVEQNIHPFPYVNGRLWGTTTASWDAENARSAAALKRSGTTYSELYNIFTDQPCAPMCPATALWQNKVADLLREIVGDYGLPGVYVDQVAIAPPMPCFNGEHGHALSGGNTWASGYQELMRQVRQRIPLDTPLATEGCCESYMDAFDVFLTLDASVERYSVHTARDPDWQPIPLFPAVYHGYALLFGSYNSLVNPPYDELWPEASRPADTLTLIDRRFSPQFRLDLGRQFVWGLQPMLANFYPEQLDVRSEELAFLRRLVRLRAAGAKYLRDGTFLRPPAVAEVPMVEIPLRTRSIYTSYDRETVHVRTVPAVMLSAWRAPDGDVALVLVNLSDQSVALALLTDWPAGGWTGQEHSPPLQRWRLGEEGQRHPLDPTEGEQVIEMAPQDAQIIEWAIVRRHGGAKE